ncbi:MAG: hypothetical protein V4640_01195 [Verrucomicrobiota bacterium]
MKRCWIHIGMPKTGTTSIQVHLVKLGQGEGWQYVAIGKSPSMNREMHAMFGTRPEKWYWFEKRGVTKEELEILRQRLRKGLARTIRRSQAENIILSSEALSLIHKSGVRQLREFLEPLFDEIRIIGYVRPPAGFMVSFFQQRLKNGAESFGRMAGPQYRERFEKYDKIFGRENVTLRKFEPATFPGGCIVRDFCEQVGIQLPDSVAIDRVNESLCLEACAILYAYRKHGKGFGIGADVILENSRIVRPLLAMKGTRFRFSRAFLDTAAGDLSDDISWMEQRLGATLHETVSEDGSEVSGEADLLLISRSACEEFVARFEEYNGVKVPSTWLPTADPVEPRQVSDLVERCREMGREKIQEKRSSRPGKPLGSRLIRAIRRWLSRTKAAPAAKPKTGPAKKRAKKRGKKNKKNG